MKAWITGARHHLEGAGAGVILLVEIGPTTHQVLRRLLFARVYGQMQRRRATLPLFIDAEAAIEEQAADAGHSAVCRVVQDAIAVRVARLDVGAAFDEGLGRA